jgi:ribonuclease PH
MNREATRGKQSGRTQEIQRLIGRSLRAIIDLKKLGERTIYIDCDVIQADGGTRTASISGAYVALSDAINFLLKDNKLSESPIIDSVAAISAGIKNKNLLLDLDYAEDSECDTDMNFVITGKGNFVEIQGTAEGKPFSKQEMDELTKIAQKSIAIISKKTNYSIRQ